MRWVMALGLFGMVACLVGCELAQTEATDEAAAQDQTPPPAEEPAPETPPAEEQTPPAVVSDGWDSIEWQASPTPTDAVKTMNLEASISDDGRFIYFSWDTLPWSDMGMGFFFVWQGDHWKGGKFEWIAPGGQSVKLTENIVEGYNGLSAPPSGTRVAFAWTSPDGSERSNLAETTWP